MGKPITDDDARQLVAALTLTMEYAVRGMVQSSALAEILIAKGLVDRDTLDAAMREVHEAKEKLAGLVFGLGGPPPRGQA